jgi:hypothetical protein
MPCEAPDCEACNHGSPTRWHAYIGIYNPDNNASAVLELPEAAADQLALLARGLPTLRGARIRATRTKSTRNARVVVELQPPALDLRYLPAAPDLPAIMATVWKLPATAVTTDEPALRQAAIRLDEIIMAKRNGTPTPPGATNATA